MLIGYAGIALLRTLSRKRVYEGLPILVLGKPGTRRASALKIEAALQLIARVAPFRWKRMRRDVKRIWAVPLASNLGEWWPGRRFCLLDDRYVEDPAVTPSQLAATIIHEATHACIDHAGISYDADRRVKIEGVCLRAEIRFARRLPDGEDIIRRAEANLSRPAEDWSDAAAAERDREGRREMMKEAHFPQWLIDRQGAGKQG